MFFLFTMEGASGRYASRREQDLLLSLYEDNKQILEDKKTEFSMECKKKKAEAWRNFQKSYNSAGFGPLKSVEQLKRMWQHMKSK